ncbi:hypothetical protein [Paraburkholderia sp.]|uniref:hypothetical protein n=1 Tax=Paraburkholderia sp. TaxID=1926495 RepID=UPI002F3E7020
MSDMNCRAFRIAFGGSSHPVVLMPVATEVPQPPQDGGVGAEPCVQDGQHEARRHSDESQDIVQRVLRRRANLLVEGAFLKALLHRVLWNRVPKRNTRRATGVQFCCSAR